MVRPDEAMKFLRHMVMEDINLQRERKCEKCETSQKATEQEEAVVDGNN